MPKQKELPPIYKCIVCNVWCSNIKECSNCGEKRSGKEKRI